MADPLEHDQATTDAITAELVACTLGTRRRPELRVDMVGTARRFVAAYARAAASLRTTLARTTLARITSEDTRP